MKKFIPVCEPTLRGNELAYITDAVKSGWISSAGKYIQEFEEKFSKYCGVKYGVSCSNGTKAIHLALLAVGIKPGDEVILPSFTMIGSCNPIVQIGAKPVFVDSELKTWNMDPTQIEEKITPKTKAIMVVHIYGHPLDMDAVFKIARKHSLIVIEDAAEAHGAEYQGRKTGSLGDIAAFSFFANKIISTGEGGMVVTNNEQWAERARKLRNHFFGEPRFLHHEVGYNYRLTNMQAALGVAQLEKINDYVNARRKNAQLYNSLLKDVPGITLPPEEPWAKNVYWMYGIVVDKPFPLTMPQLREELQKCGIETRTFFIGMHKQPAYAHLGVQGDFPNTEYLEKNGFYLPSSSHLTEEEIKYITSAIKQIYEEHKNENKK